MPERDRQAEPLCKFGPGGDFIAVWQPEASESYEPSNCLAKLLTSAVEVVAVVLGLKRASPYVFLRNAFCSDELTVCRKEKAKNAVENSEAHDTTDPAPTTATEDGGLFSGEPMLFPNLSRNGSRIKHQPKHRIRTYRRASKKGSALRFSKQGSLFESQFKSARTA
jgi:hypothetical protein